MSTDKTQRALEVKKHRDLLIESVRAHLLPVIVSQGFETVSKFRRGPTDRESEVNFPLESLIRSRGPVMDLIEIQFAPHRRAAFRINAGVASTDGMMTLTGHWPTEEICVHWLNEFFEMYDFPRWRWWFAVRFWRLRIPRQSDYERLVLRVSALLPEIELALRDRKLGPHMRKVVIPRGRTPNTK